METRASYILVGTFVLGLTAAAFAFVIWLARVEFDEPTRYLVYFEGSVTGLEVGSPVRYRGVPVGSVSDIRIDPENIERIRATLDLASGTPIKTDTVASLGLQGITGIAFIQLSGGSQGNPDLAPATGLRLAVIRSRPSGLEQVLEKAPVIFEKAVIIGERLIRLVDDRNLRAIAETLENIRALSETLARRRDVIDRLLTDSAGTLGAVRAAADNVNALTAELRARATPISDGVMDAITDVQVTLIDIRKTAQAIADIADKLDNVVEENRIPIRDFSAGGLYEITQLTAEARMLIVGLTRLTAQIERDPARFFFGDTQKGFEAR